MFDFILIQWFWPLRWFNLLYRIDLGRILTQALSGTFLLPKNDSSQIFLLFGHFILKLLFNQFLLSCKVAKFNRMIVLAFELSHLHGRPRFLEHALPGWTRLHPLGFFFSWLYCLDFLNAVLLLGRLEKVLRVIRNEGLTIDDSVLLPGERLLCEHLLDLKHLFNFFSSFYSIMLVSLSLLWHNFDRPRVVRSLK